MNIFNKKQGFYPAFCFKEVSPMPNKYELITTLYRETLNEVSNPSEWQKFLQTAGYNFRLDFDDQILLYAQKPESMTALKI